MLEQIHNLKELWLDNNSLQSIPGVRECSEHHRPRVGVFFLSSLHLILPFSSLLFHLQSIGKLRQLRYLDLAKNRIETLDADISGCEALEDLLLSSNMLQQLPDTIGTHTDLHMQILSETMITRGDFRLILLWPSNVHHSARLFNSEYMSRGEW